MIDTYETAPSKNVYPKNVTWNIEEKGKPLGYRCELRIHPEEGGMFSAYVPNLRGVVSQGDSEGAAFRNLEEALKTVLESYKVEDKEIPWSKQPEEKSDDEISRWVTVNA